ncbi:penicillin-binding protein 2, partial [Patescibacteria group bacterium]|nr:penicillin-binding protein 2 [Patescibacteria group bacterium]
SYETKLRGTVGSRTSEADARGHLKGIVQEERPVDGQDVTLTLDLRLQKIAEQTLQDELTKLKLNRGAVIAMDPRNGDILAMVSLPAYDNNAFSGGVSSTVYRALSSDEGQPLFNRAIAGIYPSGSTVKIVVSTAALMEKVISDKTTIVSTGGIRLGQWFFPDWKPGGHGVTDVRKAIAWSVNTFFYLMGGGGQQGIAGMGPEALSRWMKTFGLGKKAGIDIPGESAGFVPTPAWKQDVRKEPWYIGDTYNLSIGQGDLLVTPLQVARYTAAIANGGTLVTPRLAEDTPVQISKPLADASAVEMVRLGMRDAVVYGSARSLSILSFTSGAKTGTAQWSKTKNTHAWFTSFAPFESPEIVVTVLVDEGGEGSSVAAPVAKKILQAWNELRKGI